MSKGLRTPTLQRVRTGIAGGGPSPDERQRMIREAAYYRFIRRGFAHGHDLDDWLAAEADLLSGNPEQQPARVAEAEAFEIQQSSAHGPREDEAMKRIIKKHPQRDIPLIEGIEPQEAPLRE